MLKDFAGKNKIDFFCSSFYPEAVEFLDSLNVKMHKVASRTCLFKDPYSYETLQKKAKTGKPIIISMGMGGDKNKIKKIFSKNKVTFCYCLSEYPTEFNSIQWNESKKYGIDVIEEFFTEKLANQLSLKNKKADLLIGNNVFAHVPNINDFTNGMKIILKNIP